MGLRSAQIESKIADKLVVLSSDIGELKLAYKVGRKLDGGAPPLPEGIPIASSEPLDQLLYERNDIVYLAIHHIAFDEYFMSEWRFRRLQFHMLKRLDLVDSTEVSRMDIYRCLVRRLLIDDERVKDFIEKEIREEEL